MFLVNLAQVHYYLLKYQCLLHGEAQLVAGALGVVDIRGHFQECWQLRTEVSG